MHWAAAATLSAVADYPHPASPGRSANMRANRRRDTKPELALRQALHRRATDIARTTGST